MAEYVLSNLADQDLVEIYHYTASNFGDLKADAYLSGLDEKLNLLAEQPRLGRDIRSIREGYFRSEYANHSVFYKISDDGIFVIRVLHSRMDSKSHL